VLKEEDGNQVKKETRGFEDGEVKIVLAIK
jgi:hypothetical protein